jgi:penicillin-binding protein 1A
VDAANPDRLPSEDTYNTITKICLNVPGRPADVTWPADEAPYKKPSNSADNPGGGTPAEGDTPAPGDSSIPKLSISAPSYNVKTTKVQIPILSTYDQQKYSAMIYIKGPSASLETYNPEEVTSKSVSYILNASMDRASPGTYTFWVALMNTIHSRSWPPSNPVTLHIKD